MAPRSQHAAYWLLSCIRAAVFWSLNGPLVDWKQQLLHESISVATFALLVYLAQQRPTHGRLTGAVEARYYSLLPVHAISLGFLARTIYGHCSQNPDDDPLKHSITVQNPPGATRFWIRRTPKDPSE